MAKDLGNIAADLRRFVTFVRDLGDAADVLDDWQKQQTMADATDQRVAAGQATLVAMQGKLATMTDSINVAQAQASEILDAANKQADIIIAAGHDKAAEIAADITAQCDSIREAAHADAAATKAQVQGDIDALTATKAALADEVAKLTDEAAAKQTQVADLETRLAAVQASIAKLLG